MLCPSVEVLPSSYAAPLLHATPVRNLLRHLHAAQGTGMPPLLKLSSRLDSAVVWWTSFCRCCHSLQRDDFCREVSRSYGAKGSILSSSVSLLEPGRVESGLRLFSCFFFSTLAHTSLLISGGAIPASRYSFFDIGWPQTSGYRSTCVRSVQDPVLEACVDLAQTGHAYSAAGVRTAPMLLF